MEQVSAGQNPRTGTRWLLAILPTTGTLGEERHRPGWSLPSVVHRDPADTRPGTDRLGHRRRTAPPSRRTLGPGSVTVNSGPVRPGSRCSCHGRRILRVQHWYIPNTFSGLLTDDHTDNPGIFPETARSKSPPAMVGCARPRKVRRPSTADRYSPGSCLAAAVAGSNWRFRWSSAYSDRSKPNVTDNR